MASGPWYSIGSGGIVRMVSSVSRATSPGVSPASNATTNLSSTARSRPPDGSRREPVRSRPCKVIRARCSAEFTDAGVVSSMSAVAAAENPRTSRSTNTARCRAGSSCSPVRNASATDSRSS